MRGRDLLAGRQREFRARTVVPTAGTVEGAKIAQQTDRGTPAAGSAGGTADHTVR